MADDGTLVLGLVLGRYQIRWWWQLLYQLLEVLH